MLGPFWYKNTWIKFEVDHQKITVYQCQPGEKNRLVWKAVETKTDTIWPIIDDPKDKCRHSWYYMTADNELYRCGPVEKYLQRNRYYKYNQNLEETQIKKIEGSIPNNFITCKKENAGDIPTPVPRTPEEQNVFLQKKWETIQANNQCFFDIVSSPVDTDHPEWLNLLNELSTSLMDHGVTPTSYDTPEGYLKKLREVIENKEHPCFETLQGVIGRSAYLDVINQDVLYQLLKNAYHFIEKEMEFPEEPLTIPTSRAIARAPIQVQVQARVIKAPPKASPTHPKTNDSKIDLTKTAINVAQDVYSRWFSNKRGDHKRGSLGFFTRLRHGQSGQKRALDFVNKINQLTDYDQIITEIRLLLSDPKTKYHRHSFASFLTDYLLLVPKNEGDPIAELKKKQKDKYDQNTVIQTLGFSP